MLNFIVIRLLLIINLKNYDKTIFSQDNIKTYQEYLSLLKINLSYECLLDFYVIERILFWQAANEHKTATDYLGLF